MNRSLSTLQKGLDILNAFLPSREALSVPELSALTGVPVTSLYRFLYTLEKNEYVVRNDITGKYTLGLAVFRLGTHVAKGMGLRQTVRPILEDLARRTEESAALVVPDRDRALCIDCVESDLGIRFSQKVGRAVPLYAGAAGKVLLAFMDAGKRDAFLGEVKFRRAGSGAIQNRKMLVHRLEQIRECGYDLSRGEITEGAFGLAAPVLDRRQCAIAAISISGPHFRLKVDRLRSLRTALLTACREASEVMASDLVPAGF